MAFFLRFLSWIFCCEEEDRGYGSLANAGNTNRNRDGSYDDYHQTANRYKFSGTVMPNNYNPPIHRSYAEAKTMIQPHISLDLAFFLRFLRWIFCCEEEDRGYGSLANAGNTNRNRDGSYDDYHQTANRYKFSGTVMPNNYNPSIHRSYAEAKTTIQPHISLDLSKFLQTPSPTPHKPSLLSTSSNTKTSPCIQTQSYLNSSKFPQTPSPTPHKPSVLSAPSNAQTAPSIQPQNRSNSFNDVLRVRELGRELFISGRYAEACTVYGEGLKYSTRDHILYCNRALCWSKLGLWEQSVKDCDQALKIEPSNTKARFRRAVSNAKLERWPAAVSDFEVLRGELPENNEIADSLRRTRDALNKSYKAENSSIDPGSKPDTKTTAKRSVEAVQKPKVSNPTNAFHDRTTAGGNKATKQKLSPNLPEVPQSSSKPSPSLSVPPLSSSKPVSSSLGTPPSTLEPLLFETKPILSPAPFNSITSQPKTNYIWVEKGTSPLYGIPKEIKHLIEKDIVPGVLKMHLSPSTYKDYFAALLYAEDYYHEKWEGFKMENVTVELHEAAIYDSKRKTKNLLKGDGKDKIFVVFEMDAIPERRPFLLSRDFAYLRRSNSLVEPFKGIIYRVVKSNLVLVEFGEDFHSQHHPACRYDIKFSFNRVCLKRAHQAVATASDDLLKNFIFPYCVLPINPFSTRQLSFDHKLDTEKVSAVRGILSLQGPPPYLVEGPLSVKEVLITNYGRLRTERQLSRTGNMVREAVLNIHRRSQSNRILICAPVNSTCDMLMVSLQAEILESDMLRANAAFRERESVHEDILPSCHYKGECFSLPPLHKLQKFKVIFSTFMSSFRLRDQGLIAGHFSHIFLVDASSASEPETLVVLSNFTNERTAVVVTGAPMNRSGFIRSNIARKNGLMISYFERLRESKLYNSPDSKFIAQLGDTRGSAYFTDS